MICILYWVTGPAESTHSLRLPTEPSLDASNYNITGLRVWAFWFIGESPCWESGAIGITFISAPRFGTAKRALILIPLLKGSSTAFVLFFRGPSCHVRTISSRKWRSIMWYNNQSADKMPLNCCSFNFKREKKPAFVICYGLCVLKDLAWQATSLSRPNEARLRICCLFVWKTVNEALLCDRGLRITLTELLELFRLILGKEV